MGVVFIYVDGRKLEPEETFRLMTNDGFDSPEDFFEWFDEDFEGKIIHWTHFKY